MNDTATVISERAEIKTDLRAIYWMLSVAIGVSCSCATWVTVTTFRVSTVEAKAVTNADDIRYIEKDRTFQRDKMSDTMSRIDRRLARIEGALEIELPKDDR